MGHVFCYSNILTEDMNKFKDTYLNFAKTYFMKKLTFLSIMAVIMIVAMQSCSKVAKLLQYDIPLQSGSITITIPPTAVTSGTASGTGTNYINIDSVIKANTGNVLGISNITSVKLKSATMVLQNPDTANNFQNFSSCYASFTSNSASAPYQVSIANNPNTYASTLTLPVDTTVNLKSYITGYQFTYTAGGAIRTATTDSLKCTINFTFSIHVQG